jgi:hypothetical protein
MPQPHLQFPRARTRTDRFLLFATSRAPMTNTTLVGATPHDMERLHRSTIRKKELNLRGL